MKQNLMKDLVKYLFLAYFFIMIRGIQRGTGVASLDLEQNIHILVKKWKIVTNKFANFLQRGLGETYG